METIGPDVDQYIRELFNKFECHRREGMELISVEPRKVVVRVTVKPGTTSCYNNCQGGYLFVYTDSPMWLAIKTDPLLWKHRIYTETGIIPKFFKTVRAGNVLTVTARHIETISRGGKIFYFCAAEVQNTNGDIVAVATAVNFLVGRYTS